MTKQQTKKLAIHLATHDGDCYYVSKHNCAKCFCGDGRGMGCYRDTAKAAAIAWLVENDPCACMEALL